MSDDMINGWPVFGKDLEGNFRGSNRGTILAFAWRDWAEPRRSSVRIVGFPTEIQTQHLPNIGLDCYLCSNLLGYVFVKIGQKWRTVNSMVLELVCIYRQ
jgi:hypothetical protein